ncbi:hypothetical protein F5Y16DRAFT_378559 [Xylariaceae sp. FL0255]|nr:hypothetical protein F5Y16DRAFT_378559 [Xylariaceae sp. FL0255]
MLFRLLPAALLALISVAHAAPTRNSCKCAPGDKCWPSTSDWAHFNTTVSGKLIASKPIAISCYPGPQYDEATCASVSSNWSSAMWMGEQPGGLDYPLNITCPVVQSTANSTITADQCSIGTNPVYAVNATEVDDVVAAVRFAKEKDLRLVIKSTGHDILGRSDGFGSLEIWLRYFRNGMTIQSESEYKLSNACKAADWAGKTMTLDGPYMWGEVYSVAEASDMIMVGGGARTVSSIGGWMQGGGHGPASHYYGLGADQLLEAQVVLASGEVVTANACQNEDLFWAIRGGGPGTYGIVTSATMKAHPQVNVAVQRLFIASPAGGSTDNFLDAMATLYGEYPDLVEAGYAGYPDMQVNGSTAVAGFTTWYTHSLYIFNVTLEEAQAAGQKVLDTMSQFDKTLTISSSYTTYPDYWTFYNNVGTHNASIGYMGASTNRLLDAKSLSNYTKLRDTLEVIAGQPGENVNIALSLVAGGQVWADRSQKSAVLPAWRDTVALVTIGRVIADASPEEWQEIHDDMTYTKGSALSALAPNTGGYMNEADAYNPNWATDFYGSNYKTLSLIKSRYDPTSLFYCPTCVGSEYWEADSVGRLCSV